MRYFFVGEKPSITAHIRGWRWEDGRLAAATLFEALRHSGIDPLLCGYANLFGDSPTSQVSLTGEAVARAAVIDGVRRGGVQIVAMGKKVSAALDHLDVPHTMIVHPAARGAIRAKGRYEAHVMEVLAA